MKSVLRIDYSNEKSEMHQCDCGDCHGTRFDIAYSMYHASVIGWRAMKVPPKEAKKIPFRGYDFPLGRILLCPDCAKNTQQVQADPDLFVYEAQMPQTGGNG
jgi:hypothetical protein